MPCHAMPCHAMPYHTTPYHTICPMGDIFCRNTHRVGCYITTPQEVSHVDNNSPVVLSNCYKPLLTSVGMHSVVFDSSSRSPEYSFDDCVSHTLDSNLNNLSNFLLYRRQHEDAMSTDVLSMYTQVSLFHHSRIDVRFLWDVNDSVVHHEMLVHPFGDVCNCTCPAISLLHECTHSAMDVVIQDVGLNLSYINNYLLFIGSTVETSNLDIKSESVLSFYGFDPTKCFVYDPPMSRLIPDFSMSLDVDNIFAAHASQLVS